MKQFKLAIVSSHPIQYKAPLFRELSNQQEIDLSVYYSWNAGETEYYDPEFGVTLQWDIPLLGGYEYTFLRNYSPFPGPSLLGQINPAVIQEIICSKYDAVWVDGYTTITAWLTFLAAIFSRTPIILRGEANLLVRRFIIKRLLKRILLSPLLKTVSAVLFSCRSNKEYYKYYGVPDRKLFFGPSAIDNDWIWEQEIIYEKTISELRKELSISSHEKIILFVGKLISRKRPIDVLKAFELIRNRIEASIIFVGDGPQKEFMERYAEKNNIENVYFVGFINQSEMPRFYLLASLIVISSDRDPSPKVLNEALALGLPAIISNRVGTGGDLVIDGVNGFIYPVGDVNSLACSMSLLLNHSKLTKEMGVRSRAIVSNWSYSKVVEGVLTALQSVTPKIFNDHEC